MTALLQWTTDEDLLLGCLEALIAVTIVASLAWALDALQRHRSYAFSRTLWLSALMIIGLTPVVISVGPRLPWRVSLLRANRSHSGQIERQQSLLPADAVSAASAVPPLSSSSIPDLPLTNSSVAYREHDLQPRSGPSGSFVPSTMSWPQLSLAGAAKLCLTIWVAGTGYLLLRLGLGLWRIGRLKSTGRPIGGANRANIEALAEKRHIPRFPDLIVSADVRCPVVVGLFSPCIMLPESCVAQCGRQEIEDILVHEWAHIAQFDPWMRLIQQLNAAVYWFHPLVHLVNRRFARASEEICDNQVLARDEPCSYAETLIKVTQLCYPKPADVGYITITPPHWRLETRIAGLVASNRDKTVRLRGHQRMLAAVSLLLLFAAASSAGLRPPADGSTPVLDPAVRSTSNQELDYSALTGSDGAASRKGLLCGQITGADTGKPLANAIVRVMVEGVPGRAGILEAKSNSEGRYELPIPFGGCRFFGLWAPPGFYTQDAKTYDYFVVSPDNSTVVRNFSLRPGAAWRVELTGVQMPVESFLLFTAWPGLEQQTAPIGESIEVSGDARGKAVLTIPTKAAAYRFFCNNMSNSLPGYEIPTAKLEIDDDFNPQKAVGRPEPAPERGLRIRDRAGRSAVIRGADVLVDQGEAVIHFQVKPIPDSSALLLKGVATDEAGRPVTGATVDASFAYPGGGYGWSGLHVVTDDKGQYELQNVKLPQSMLDKDHRVRLQIHKPGYAGAQTQELSLAEIKKNGSGDFGTVALKPGHVLRGKVVDDAGRPVLGAGVMNRTNYSLYFNLQCRTDADGRFAMHDLPFGPNSLSADFGDRHGEEEFNFTDKSSECVITVRPSPKSGMRKDPDSKWNPKAFFSALEREQIWDLTPPRREPTYQKQARYALLAFGPKKQNRIWLVLDGNNLYVDRNGDGDLTEPGKRFLPQRVPSQTMQAADLKWEKPEHDLFEFTLQSKEIGPARFQLRHWLAAPTLPVPGDLEKRENNKLSRLGGERTTIRRLVGEGQMPMELIFVPKPADAQVCAFDGGLTFILQRPDYQVLQKGDVGCNLFFQIIEIGRPYRGGDQPCFTSLGIKDAPKSANLEVQIEYPVAGASHVSPSKYSLKERCCGNAFYGAVHVPPQATGVARVAVNMAGWPDRPIQPVTVEVPIED